ncbi:hypothetical protein KSP40_PGU004207 [Platanthera guangdongensis]|uniref:Uncharacterized protein n=1 Tax=Platanthera guangdongensis TaxID=2320717 RepID=A0ABR2LPK1_9ASPA
MNPTKSYLEYQISFLYGEIEDCERCFTVFQQTIVRIFVYSDENTEDIEDRISETNKQNRSRQKIKSHIGTKSIARTIYEMGQLHGLERVFLVFAFREEKLMLKYHLIIPPYRTHKLPETNRTQTAVHEDAHSSLLEDSKTSLIVFNFTIEEADLLLKKAFGWIHSPYWGEERRKEAPQLDSIEQMIKNLPWIRMAGEGRRINEMRPAQSTST